MKYGEIVQLGRHRLMCGDATKYEDIEELLGGDRVNLVLTDPPYGMKCQHKDGNIGSGKRHVIDPNKTWKNAHPGKKQHTAQAKRYPLIVGDDSQEAARRHYDIIKHFTKRQIFWGGQYFAHFLPTSGGWLFWNKLTGKSDFSDGELAWRSFGKRVYYYEQRWCGTVMSCSCKINAIGGNNPHDTRSRVHPTQKPVELHMQILEDFSEPDDVILDCFGGSGTTLIACQLTGRTCLMMELSPDYCDIIKKRYETLTEGVIDFAGCH